MPVRSTLPTRTLVVAVTLLGPLGLGPARAAAQIEFSPTVGIFLPAVELMELGTTVGPAPTDTSVSRWSHRTAAAVGARLTFWLSGRAAVEASLVYSESGLELVSVPMGERRSTSDATLLAGTVRGLLRFGVSEGTSLHLMAGLGLLSRGGHGYVRFERTTELALLAGAGLVIRLAPHIAVRLDLEDYMSSPGLRIRSEPAASGPGGVPTVDLTVREAHKEIRFQHYLVIAPAVSIRLGGF
jgi:hypothetical protein